MRRRPLLLTAVPAGMLLTAVTAAMLPASAAVATLPPDGGGEGVAIVREQTEAAAAEYFAGVAGEVSHVTCELPAEDAPGVVFYCFAVDANGTPLVAQAAVNDYGTAELSAVAAATPATTAASTTTNPILDAAQGTGSQVVQVSPITEPTIVAVTHDGAGEFAVQPQHGGVAVGPPLAAVTGAWSGRYLVGLGGTISSFAVTADGAWTITVLPRGMALPFDPAAGADGQNADVVAYADDAASSVTVVYEGTGQLVVRASTVSGASVLADQLGPFTGDIEVPAGPGFLSVEAAGAWSLRPQAAPPTSAAPGSTG
jgi:hypothetical protein